MITCNISIRLVYTEKVYLHVFKVNAKVQIVCTSIIKIEFVALFLHLSIQKKRKSNIECTILELKNIIFYDLTIIGANLNIL